MRSQLASLDEPSISGMRPRRRLAAVLEAYLADLEQGLAPSEEALLAAHPDLADELRPYLDSLQLLHGATVDEGCSSAHHLEAPAAQKEGHLSILMEGVLLGVQVTQPLGDESGHPEGIVPVEAPGECDEGVQVPRSGDFPNAEG